MFGNRGIGRFSGQQGLLGNANILMGNQMAGLAVNQANMRLLNQGGGQRDLRGGAGFFPMNPSVGMREMQRPGGFGMDNRLNMPAQAQEAVIDILPRRTAARGMRRGGYSDRRGRGAASFSPPLKRSRLSGARDDDDDTEGDRKSTRGKFKCQVCRLQFASINEFDDHMASEGHAANMKVMSAVYHDKNQEALQQVYVGVEKRGRPKPTVSSSTSSSTSRSGMCPLCQRSYGTMSEYQHRMSKQHKHRQYLVQKGCVLCSVKGFENYPDYVLHIDSDEHKQKKRELTSANAAAAPVKTSKSPSDSVKSVVKKPAAKETEAVQKSPAAEKRSVADELPTQSESASPSVDIAVSSAIYGDDMLDDPIYNPDIAVGVEQVISVTGYFCKLCHKFYNNETMARITHCKTQTHFDKYLDHLRQKAKSSSVQEVTTTHRNARGQ